MLFIITNHYAAYQSDITKLFDHRVYDKYTQLFKSGIGDEDGSHVVVVDIDEKSLNALGQWPWPRVVVAKLMQKINALNPSTIGIDIIFPEKDRTSPKEISLFYKKFFDINNSIAGIPEYLQDNDVIFADVLKSTRSVMSIYLSEQKVGNDLGSSMNSLDIDLEGLDIELSENILRNTPALEASSKYIGYINMGADRDGVLRRMPLFRKYNQTLMPTLSLATLLSLGADIKSIGDKNFEILNHTVTTDKQSRVLMNFYSDKWYKKVSAVDILNENISKDMITGKIVLIGSSAAALHDQVIITGGEKSIGVKVHVTLIDNILHDDLLVQPEYYKDINILISMFMTFLLFYLLIKKYNTYILILFFTSFLSMIAVSILFFNEGIYISIGYLAAPFLMHFFAVSMMYIAIDTYDRRIFSEDLNRSHVALLDSMVHVAEVHDIETGAHIVRTKKYIKLLAEYIDSKGMYKNQLSPNIIEMMYRTAPLHDIGKVGIEDAILKKPGKLTAMEYEVMKTHAVLGKHIIDNAISSYEKNDFFVMARNIALYHHEKWDGTGYPDGLKGNEIPLESRFMALSDVYDALVSKRVYKKAFSYENTIKIIIDGRGKHFDPILVDAFVEIQEQFKEIAETYSDNTIIKKEELT